jgi:hypothetical protein
MRLLVFFHRWVGTGLCLFFTAWFFSGAVMIYHPFPSLSEEERISRSPDLDPNQIEVPPSEVIRSSGGPAPDRLRLIDLEGRPVYVIHGLNGEIAVLGADNGSPVPPRWVQRRHGKSRNGFPDRRR